MPLHYQIKGNRTQPVLVFLHGFLGSHQDWLPLMAPLEKKFCCLLVDLPGHGKSLCQKLTEPPSFSQVTTDLKQILQALNIPCCGLVGYSLGGRMALAFTVAYPHLVQKLVLESCHPGLQNWEEKQARLQSDEVWAKKLETLGMHSFLEAWYQQEVFQSLKKHPNFESLRVQRLHHQGANLAQALRGMSLGRQDSFWEALPNLSTNMLLIAGEHDSKYCSIFQQIASLAPQATLFQVEGAGHNVHFEKPAAFSAMLEEFFIKEPWEISP